MRHIDVLAKRFGEETVAGGVCNVAATIDPAGRILPLDLRSKREGRARE